MTGVTIAQIGDDTAIVVASSGDNVTIVQGVEAAGPPGVGGGVTDHGALTGLADDDHTQYHNDTRGDARYTQKSNNLSDLASASSARTNLGLGGSATLNVGTTAGTVAAGDDSRFTDSRTPSGSAGGDLTGTYPNPTIGTGKVTSTNILDGTIVDGDINASAAIALSKLAQPANAAVTMAAWSLFA